ncbi:MAG: DUF2478 domain-containing protein [Rhizobiales bacterium]|nr:DUF2478 domain-containing protein [Hyphomicrobiales bacterium]
MTTDASRQILALHGASGAAVQAMLAAFAARRRAEGVAVAGVVEIADAGGPFECSSLTLRDVATGDDIPISQDLGAGSTSCNLDAGGLAAACGRIEAAVASGAQLVVLSKFGKQETLNGGLVAAFASAIAAGVPIATSVAPSLAAAWARFAADLAQSARAEPQALEDWWRSLAKG